MSEPNGLGYSDAHPGTSLQGAPQIQVPDSCKTIFFAANAAWTVDEEPDDVIRLIDACLSGGQASLKLHADRRPIYFSKQMLMTWTVAWPPKRTRVAPASPSDARALGLVGR